MKLSLGCHNGSDHWRFFLHIPFCIIRSCSRWPLKSEWQITKPAKAILELHRQIDLSTSNPLPYLTHLEGLLRLQSPCWSMLTKIVLLQRHVVTGAVIKAPIGWGKLSLWLRNQTRSNTTSMGNPTSTAPVNKHPVQATVCWVRNTRVLLPNYPT